MARVMQGRAKEKKRNPWDILAGVGTTIAGVATGNPYMAAGGAVKTVGAATGSENVKQLGTVVGGVTSPEDEDEDYPSVNITNPTLRKYM